MIFRIINGERVLFAEVNKLEAVNGKIASSTLYEDENGKKYKNVWIDATDIHYEGNNGDTIYQIIQNILDKEEGFVKKTSIRRSEATGKRSVVTGIAPVVYERGDTSDALGRDNKVDIIQFSNDIDKDDNGSDPHDVAQFQIAGTGRVNITRIGSLGDTGVPTRDYGVELSVDVDDLVDGINTNATNISNLNTELTNTNRNLQITNEALSDLNHEVTVINSEVNNLNKTVYGDPAPHHEDPEDNTSPWVFDPKSFLGVRKRFETLENEVVKSVNGMGPEEGNVQLDGKDIKLQKNYSDGETDEGTITQNIRDIWNKLHIDGNDKVLEWTDRFLSATVGLKLTGSRLSLIGKNNEEIESVDLALDSMIVWSGIVTRNDHGWLKPDDISDEIWSQLNSYLDNYGNTAGDYLVLVFETVEGDLQFTVANFSDLLKDYTAGDAIDITNHVVSVKLDANNTTELQITNNGLLYKPNIMSQVEFEALNLMEGDKSQDGIYYIEE